MAAIALIDTSRAPAWVGGAEGRAQRLAELGGGRHAGDRLLSTFLETLAELHLDLRHLDALVVVVGPGSFTGLRAGVAAAQGIGRATGLSLVGVSGLELTARAAGGVPGEWLLPLGAGRNGRLYGGLFRVDARGTPCVEGAVAEREVAAWREVAPAGCRWLRAGAPAPEIDGLPSPDRGACLAAALALVATGVADTPPAALQPLYVRDWMGHEACGSHDA